MLYANPGKATKLVLALRTAREIEQTVNAFFANWDAPQRRESDLERAVDESTAQI